MNKTQVEYSIIDAVVSLLMTAVTTKRNKTKTKTKNNCGI